MLSKTLTSAQTYGQQAAQDPVTMNVFPAARTVLVAPQLSEMNNVNISLDAPSVGEYLMSGARNGCSYTIKVAASTSNTSGVMTLYFRGRAFGIGLLPLGNNNVLQSGEPIGVFIDGRSYPPIYPNVVGLYDFNDGNDNGGTSTQGNVTYLVDDCLMNGNHVVDLVFPSQYSNDSYWQLIGWLFDADAGYQSLQESSAWQIPGTPGLTTSYSSITGFNVNNMYITAVTGVLYVNTSGSAVEVLVTNGTNVIKTIYLAASGSSGDSYEWAIPEGVYWDYGTPQHKASAGSAVNYMLRGRLGR